MFKIDNYLAKPVRIGDRVAASDYAPSHLQGRRGVFCRIKRDEFGTFMVVKWDTRKKPQTISFTFAVPEEFA